MSRAFDEDVRCGLIPACESEVKNQRSLFFINAAFRHYLGCPIRVDVVLAENLRWPCGGGRVRGACASVGVGCRAFTIHYASPIA